MTIVKAHRVLQVVLACCLMSALQVAEAGEWIPVLEDEFDREMIGPNWRVLRGDWRIEAESLRITRAWPSDNNLLCTKTMPRGDMRAVVKFRLEPDCFMHLALRAGEYFWGGGGFADDFAAHISSPKSNTEIKVDGGSIRVPPDRDCTVELTVEGGKGTIALNGNKLIEKPVPPARSEFNRGLYINCLPNGWIESVKLYTKPGQTLALPLGANSMEENKRATVFAKEFIDPMNPAVGMQKAIDSLPSSGGAVILPAGEFLMRRHLALPSGVTLRGQGHDKTVLRACPFHGSKVMKVEEREGDCVVTLEDASAFKVGDGVCYGRAWGHPAMPANPNLNHVITEIDGNVVTVSGGKPKKSGFLSHFFPLVYSVAQEFVGVQDLTLTWTPPPAEDTEVDPKTGKPKKRSGYSGGFLTCPVTFGALRGGRIARVNVEGYPADGISVQGAADTMVTDNTVTGTGAGSHPGTRTQRFLWARNRSVGNHTGLYFCFSNENGLYCHNTTDDFTGYPGVGDVFNILSNNDCVKGIGIGGGGYAGLFFNNRMPSLSTSACPSDPGRPIYFSAPHYYVFAENRLAKLQLGEGTEAIVIAGNTPMGQDGTLEVAGDTGPNLYSEERLGLARRLELPTGVGRDEPVPAPTLPDPVLDGRRFYDAERPDCGFQKALDELAGEGGTLQLPGGRYPLGASLRIPSNVTLAAHGIGTVLYAADGYAGSLIVSEKAKTVTIRALSILSRYDPETQRGPAISVRRCEAVLVEGIDVRGWEGVGIETVDSSVTVRDCRAFGCAGDGYRLGGPTVRVCTTLASSCARGIILEQTAAASVEDSIVSGSRGAGIVVVDGKTPLVHASSSSFNGGDGILLRDVTGGHVIANLCRANNQALKDGAGIRLAGTTSGCTTTYNHCSDDQLHATQAHGIIEEGTASRNTVRFNLTCPFYMNHQPQKLAPVVAQGKGSDVRDNLVRNASPSGSSIESRALGFFGTPHSHNMRENARLGRKKSLDGQLKNREAELKRHDERIADTKQKINALKRQAEPDAKKLEALGSTLKKLEQGRRPLEERRQLQELAVQTIDQEIAIAAQEKKVRYRKFAVISLRNQGADQSKIKQAEAALKADEQQLASLRAELRKLNQ